MSPQDEQKIIVSLAFECFCLSFSQNSWLYILFVIGSQLLIEKTFHNHESVTNVQNLCPHKVEQVDGVILNSVESLSSQEFEEESTMDDIYMRLDYENILTSTADMPTNMISYKQQKSKSRVNSE